MTKLRALVLWLILMWGSSAPIGARAVGCPANIRLSRLTGAAPVTSCVGAPTPTLSNPSTPAPSPTRNSAQPINTRVFSTPVSVSSITSNLVSTTTATPTTNVELILITSGPTLLGSGENLPVLQIGRQKFYRPCRMSSTLPKPDSFSETICSLTLTEFASVTDGEEVTYRTGDFTGFFGPLVKSNLRLMERLDQKKHLVFDDLASLRAEYLDAQQDTRYDSVIQQLSFTALPSRWLDGTHLQTTEGINAFTADINATTTLQQIMDTPISVYEQARLQIMIESRIVYVDAGLAKVAFIEASTASGNPSELAQALSELIQADKEKWNHSYISALTHYRNAWQHAMNAMQAAKLRPTITPSATATPTATP